MTSISSLLGELIGDDSSFSADLSAFLHVGTATFDESALPENDISNPKDKIGRSSDLTRTPGAFRALAARHSLSQHLVAPAYFEETQSSQIPTRFINCVGGTSLPLARFWGSRPWATFSSRPPLATPPGTTHGAATWGLPEGRGSAEGTKTASSIPTAPDPRI